MLSKHFLMLTVCLALLFTFLNIFHPFSINDCAIPSSRYHAVPIKEQLQLIENVPSYNSMLLARFFARARTKSVRVGVIGGSISWGYGCIAGTYGICFTSWLNKRFKLNDSNIHILDNRAQGGTQSPFASLCLASWFSDSLPDIVFVEFAVNDYSDAPEADLFGSSVSRWGEADDGKTIKTFFRPPNIYPPNKNTPVVDIISSMERIARFFLRREIPVVFVYLSQYFLPQFSGREHKNAQLVHSFVAKQYGLASISFSDYNLDSPFNHDENENSFEYFFDNRHLNCKGHKFVAALIVGNIRDEEENVNRFFSTSTSALESVGSFPSCQLQYEYQSEQCLNELIHHYYPTKISKIPFINPFPMNNEDNRGSYCHMLYRWDGKKFSDITLPVVWKNGTWLALYDIEKAKNGVISNQTGSTLVVNVGPMRNAQAFLIAYTRSWRNTGQIQVWLKLGTYKHVDLRFDPANKLITDEELLPENKKDITIINARASTGPKTTQSILTPVCLPSNYNSSLHSNIPLFLYVYNAGCPSLSQDREIILSYSNSTWQENTPNFCYMRLGAIFKV